MDASTDAQIVLLSLEDPEAFGAIFDRHAPVLLRYLMRRVGRTTAEPLLGDVFHTAFEIRARFDPARSSALPWLYGIASNLLQKHHRTEGRRLRATARLATEPLPETGGVQAVEAACTRRQLERVAARIDELPATERDVLLLFAWEGLSYPQIAEALEVPVGTIRSRLHRARGKLREPIDPSGKEKDIMPTRAAGPRR